MVHTLLMHRCPGFRRSLLAIVVLITCGLFLGSRGVSECVWLQKALGGKQPLLLRNKDGRCVSNALMQVFYALTQSRGWSLMQQSDHDPIASLWEQYDRCQHQRSAAVSVDDEPIFEFDLIGDMTVDLQVVGGRKRYNTDVLIEPFCRYFQNRLAQEGIYAQTIVLDKPSERSAAEHEHTIAQAIQQDADNKLPDALLVVCDYSQDTMFDWETLYKPHCYVQLDHAELAHPYMPTLIAIGEKRYRIVSLVNLVQHSIPTSAAGKFIVRHDPAIWNGLKVPNAHHATAAVRWGDQWFYLDDTLRYSVCAETANGMVNQSSLLVDRLVMERTPGTPVVCLYEQVSGDGIGFDSQPTNEFLCIWDCRDASTTKRRTPEWFRILHSSETMPRAQRRVFRYGQGFLPV